MASKDLRAFLAEFIGTFALVFVGSAAVWVSSQTGYAGGPLVPAFAHGLVVVFAAYSLGHISGALLNPAVTLAAAIAGGIDWARAGIYVVVQLVAGILAALLLNALLIGQGGLRPAAQFGAFSYNALYVNSIGALFVEAVLTFLLAFVVLQAAVKGRAGNLAGLVVGLTLAGVILAGGALTGASLNPARSLGPALIAGDLSQIWIYLIGPVLGGGLAAIVYSSLIEPSKSEPTPPKKNTGRRT
ncbi:MAG: aquaporin [Thermoflexales bacterium]|nr:aquaporin [Thermoflexales bacterium]